MNFQNQMDRLPRWIKPSSRAQRQKRLQRRLMVEPLDDRTLPSVSFGPPPLTSIMKGTVVNRPDIPLGTFGNPFQEPVLSVNDRADPGNIVVTSQRGMRLTTNAGGSFTGLTNFPIANQGDTWTDFDFQGRLFWSNLDAPLGGGGTSGVAVAEINPTTGAPVPKTNPATGAVVSSGTFVVSTPLATQVDDREAMAVDSNPASPFVNNIYVVWTRFGSGSSVMVSRSSDHGVTWSTPVQISGPGEGWVHQVHIAVAPNGWVYAAYHSQPNFSDGAGQRQPDGLSGQIFVARSWDGGLHFTKTSTQPFGPKEADLTWNFQTVGGKLPGALFQTRGSVQPYVMADPARPGNVYVIAADDPDDNHGTGDDANIRLARSTDYGNTWTTSTLVAGPVDVPGTINNSFQLFPTAAIDRFGNIVVAWYDNRRGQLNGNSRFLLDVFAKYSMDGGRTWTADFMVNDPGNAFNPDESPIPFRADDGVTSRIGEYFGLDIFGGTAYVAWNGNTPSNPTTSQQVWFDAFPIKGALTVNGDDNDVAPNDVFILQSMAGNPDFAEVLVNGKRQYAGLWTGLTGGITINAGSGNDGIFVENLAAGVSAMINGGSGNDLIMLSPIANNLDNLEGSFIIDGGDGADEVDVLDAGSAAANPYTISASTMTRNGSSLITSYAGLETLYLQASVGGNIITVQSTMAATSVTIDGGSGTDTLDYSGYTGGVTVNLASGSATGLGRVSGIENVTGGSGTDTLIGDGANNVLVGGGGRDLLIGGAGADTLMGGTGDDILIGGLYDAEPHALALVMAEWTRTDLTYLQRIDHLRNGGAGSLNGSARLNSTTISDDAAADTLTGDAGLDWFWANSAEVTDLGGEWVWDGFTMKLVKEVLN